MTNDHDDTNLGTVSFEELHAVEGGGEYHCPDPTGPYPWKHPWIIPDYGCNVPL